MVRFIWKVYLSIHSYLFMTWGLSETDMSATYIFFEFQTTKMCFHVYHSQNDHIFLQIT